MIMFPLILIVAAGVLNMTGAPAGLSIGMVGVALAMGATEWVMGVYHK